MWCRLLLCSAVIGVAVSIECYTGLKLIAGQSIGSATIQCENSGAFCYNMTASAAALIDVVKAGCSMWRCMLARDKCISTTFQNIPISLCCCSGDRCNQGGGMITKQQSGGWNSEPDSGSDRADGSESTSETPQNMRSLNREEVARRFNSMEVDDDHSHSSTRGDRHEVRIP